MITHVHLFTGELADAQPRVIIGYLFSDAHRAESLQKAMNLIGDIYTRFSFTVIIGRDTACRYAIIMDNLYV